ncbi:MAG TPA: type 4a pilus biogenesis protein PilO [Patescibacteria group bacterium]|jgi:Tfp pilus assembly protein PilO
MADSKRRQLNTLLDQFYHNPVAMVSFELFLSIGAIIFFSLFAIRPTLATMADLIKEIEDKQKLSTQLSQKAAALNIAQDNFTNVQEQISVLDEAIPLGADLAHTLKVIEKVASDQSLAITNLTVLKIPTTPPEDIPFSQLTRQTMSIQLTATGSYEAIRGFAEQLQDSRRSFVMDRIIFTTEDSRGQRTLEAVLLIGAPYFGLEEK